MMSGHSTRWLPYVGVDCFVCQAFWTLTLGCTLKFGVGTPMTVYQRFAMPVLPNQETSDISRAGRRDCLTVRKRRQEGFKLCAKRAFLLGGRHS